MTLLTEAAILNWDNAIPFIYLSSQNYLISKIISGRLKISWKHHSTPGVKQIPKCYTKSHTEILTDPENYMIWAFFSE